MKTNPLPHEKILYICLNERETGECCGGKGSAALHGKLKSAIRERGLSSRIRISRSGCQGRCGDGPNAQLFPDNLWFSGITESDIDLLLDKLTEGSPSR